ncbi:MAG TPA: hypothetical protein VFV97_08300 [Rhodanobacteraceae bacterium]|nr:hypothetical protein [Rhodanobacteraceae bacterium]
MRLRWGTVALLSVAFAAGAAIALAYSVREDASNRPRVSATAFADEVPFDFAEEHVRAAIADYARFYDGLPPIMDGCRRGSGEVYRVAVEATMSRSMDYAAVDVIVSGDRAQVTVRVPSLKTRQWQLSDSRAVGPHEIAVLRERAGQLLTSNIAPAIVDQTIDSEEWTVEMCGRGRYHFFQRHNPRDDKANAPFNGFTDAVMALRRGIDPGA